MELLGTPWLTRRRIWLALGVAVATDGLQFMLGPLGWTFVDEILDVAAMVIISFLVGFHPLLLPTFVVEFFPVVDMLPTWTGCVAAVVALRKRRQKDLLPTPSVGHASMHLPPRR